jgi:hypothetical protein
MLKNHKGFGSITLYMGLAIVVLALVGGFWIKALKADLKFYKAENVKLTAENKTWKDSYDTQVTADATALKDCQDGEAAALAQLAERATPTKITGCPTITEITDKNDQVVKDVEAMGWEVQK